MTQKRVFFVWAPLAAMWVMMAVELPLINAVIARMPNAEANLAAFGVTFSLSLIIESPIIMLLSAGTALPNDPYSYKKLLRFTHILAGILTLIHIVVAVTPLYEIVLKNVIDAPERIIPLSRHAFLIMVPWSGAIAYRRLFQGILIKYMRTWIVPVTIISRLITAAAVLGSGFIIQSIPGSSIGAYSLSIGVIVAAFSAYGFARKTIREQIHTAAPNSKQLTWRFLLRFYIPLALTTIITLVGRSIITLGIARASFPMPSLAVWPVVMGFIFIGRSLALSFQEAAITLLPYKGSYPVLRNFTLSLSLILGILFLVAGITPLSELYYSTLAGLKPELVDFTLTPTLIMSVVPLISALISWRRGQLIYIQNTSPISKAVGLNLIVLLVVLFTLGPLTTVPGVTIAGIALSMSVAVEYVYLFYGAGNIRSKVNKYHISGI